jgi:sulfur carrier protein ThiS
MQITFNGKVCEVENGISASNLIRKQGYMSKTSIWVNGIQLLKAEYDSYIIPEMATVKVLRIVGGG